MLHGAIKKTLDYINDTIEYPVIKTIEGASTNPEVVIDGRKVLMFCSNNYLSLANNAEVKDTVKKAVDIYGMGSGGSRLVSGNISIQKQLEKTVADFKSTKDAMTFVTGYMTNTGVIPAILNPAKVTAIEVIKEKLSFGRAPVVFSDELNHASIVDGIKLSNADKVIYRHRDMSELENALNRYKKHERKLIVTDGVFSMDGDIAPLDKIMELALKYHATVMVDDAHATGILGDHGKGTMEYFKMAHHPQMIIMGTFTKVFGGIGGFIATDKEMTDYLRVTARSYIFSAPIPPAICAGLIAAINIVDREPERRLRLWENINHLKNLLDQHGFNTLNSETQIIPIFIGDDKKAIQVSNRLFELGIFLPCMRWPAVGRGQSRLRLTLMSEHTKDQIDTLVEALVVTKKEFNF